MSEASDKLNRSRQAILDHIAGKQRRHDPREVPAPGDVSGDVPGAADGAPGVPVRRRRTGGLFDRIRHVLDTWWRHHPAHMAVELTSPLMRGYARRKPLQLLGIALAAGAALTFARPWRVISITTLIVALLKSSQLSSLFMAALSAADYRKDHDGPE